MFVCAHMRAKKKLSHTYHPLPTYTHTKLTDISRWIDFVEGSKKIIKKLPTHTHRKLLRSPDGSVSSSV